MREKSPCRKMNNNLFLFLSILSILIIIIILGYFYYNTQSKNKNNEIDKLKTVVHYVDIDDLVSKEEFVSPIDKETPLFTTVSTYPIQTFSEVNDRQYFNEINMEEFKSILQKGHTASLPQEWDTLLPYSKKIDCQVEDSVKKAIDNCLSNYTGLYDKSQNRIIPFKVKKLQLVEVRLPSYDNVPLSYSKWEVIVHRENKAYGFAFQAIFLHIEDYSYFCEDMNHTQLHEDLVETLTALPDQSLSESESGSSPLNS